MPLQRVYDTPALRRRWKTLYVQEGVLYMLLERGGAEPSLDLGIDDSIPRNTHSLLQAEKGNGLLGTCVQFQELFMYRIMRSLIAMNLIWS